MALLSHRTDLANNLRNHVSACPGDNVLAPPGCLQPLAEDPNA